MFVTYFEAPTCWSIVTTFRWFIISSDNGYKNIIVLLVIITVMINITSGALSANFTSRLTL